MSRKLKNNLFNTKLPLGAGFWQNTKLLKAFLTPKTHQALPNVTHTMCSRLNSSKLHTFCPLLPLYEAVDAAFVDLWRLVEVRVAAKTEVIIK